MNSFWIKTHWLVKKIFSKYVWDVPNNDKKVYLTFDDGPIPDVTEWVLSELKKHNAKATFFCIGDNVKKHLEVLKKVFAEGHSVGNHTFNHLNGWKTATEDYIENSILCEKVLDDFDSKSKKLFRPPYGKIKPSQSKILRKLGYKIIMWDVISYDFDTTISKEQCLENVLKNVKTGSIIVFHDSKKAFANLEYVLPRTLQFLKEKGFIFEKL
jgi:peptidoglycan/xylan/chitin deacetylase (PgdA/CDA1 family)